jgi:hypothetical protein
MADRGIKLLKDGKSVTSTDIEDYNFWTKYPPMTLLEVKSIEIDTSVEGCEGVKNVPHDYDYIPLVVGLVRKIDGIPSYDYDERYLMPVKDFTSINCGDGLMPVVSFDYKVYDDGVDILFNATCEIMGMEECPLNNVTFQVDLLFFMWELGASWGV